MQYFFKYFYRRWVGFLDTELEANCTSKQESGVIVDLFVSRGCREHLEGPGILGQGALFCPVDDGPKRVLNRGSYNYELEGGATNHIGGCIPPLPPTHTHSDCSLYTQPPCRDTQGFVTYCSVWTPPFIARWFTPSSPCPVFYLFI
jgi:hypothetical protein